MYLESSVRVHVPVHPRMLQRPYSVSLPGAAGRRGGGASRDCGRPAPRYTDVASAASAASAAFASSAASPAVYLDAENAIMSSSLPLPRSCIPSDFFSELKNLAAYYFPLPPPSAPSYPLYPLLYPPTSSFTLLIDSPSVEASFHISFHSHALSMPVPFS
jgi:hypothetical protein